MIYYIEIFSNIMSVIVEGFNIPLKPYWEVDGAPVKLKFLSLHKTLTF